MTDAGFPYLSILTLLPLVGAVVVALVPRAMPALAMPAKSRSTASALKSAPSALGQNVPYVTPRTKSFSQRVPMRDSSMTRIT